MLTALLAGAQLLTSVVGGFVKAGAAVKQIGEQIDQNKDNMWLIRGDIAGEWNKANADLAQIGQQNQYQLGQLGQKLDMEAGTAAAKVGYSGVRGASPLQILRQQEQNAAETLAAASSQANYSMTSRGLDATILTQKAQRNLDLLDKNNKYLQSIKGAAWWSTMLGSVPSMLGAAQNLAGALG